MIKCIKLTARWLAETQPAVCLAALSNEAANLLSMVSAMGHSGVVSVLLDLQWAAISVQRNVTGRRLKVVQKRLS